MKKLTTLVTALAIVFVGAFSVLTPATGVAALDPAAKVEEGIEAAGGGGDDGDKLPALVKTIINILLYVLGAVAVIMIVIGGIRYTISNGDSSQITGAKNTVLYSVIGLVVALLAYAIVNFVVGAF